MIKLISDNKLVSHRVIASGDIPQDFIDVVDHCATLLCPDSPLTVVLITCDMGTDTECQVSQEKNSIWDDYYQIDISSLFNEIIEESGMNYMLSQLCHEFVHINQFNEGLLCYEDNILYCRGIEVSDNEPEYWFSHHEIEARGLQDGLLQAYLNKDDPEWVDWKNKLTEIL